MRTHSGLLLIPLVAISSSASVRATVYLSAEQAIPALFSGKSAADFKPSTLKLTDDQRKAISDQSGLRVRDKDYRIWTAGDGSRLYVDEVVGKHDYITFALGVGTDGKVRGVEILEYRETYGGEVRRPEWRKQFVGKKLGDAFKLDGDIMNITGATLSSHSITDGVKRLLTLRAVMGK